LKNAGMHEQRCKEIKGPEATYDQVPIKEELDAQNEAKTAGEPGECWVDPTK